MDNAAATQAASNCLKTIFANERHLVPNDQELRQLAAKHDWLGVLKRLNVILQWAEFEGQYRPPLRGDGARKNPSYQAGEILARAKGVYLLAIRDEHIKQGGAFCRELIPCTNPLRE